MTLLSATVADNTFIREQSTCGEMFVHPNIGVRKGPDPQVFTSDGGLAEMMQPGNCPVPIGVTISERESDQLAAPARSFFRNMLRPVIKHV